MSCPVQTVTRLLNQSCVQHPGGMKAVWLGVKNRHGIERSVSSFYADCNPNPSTNGSLKVEELIFATEETANYSAIRFIAAYFGFALVPLNSVEPDAPTVELEMLQDYPALVAFHEAVQAYKRGEIEYDTVLIKLDNVLTDIRQTAAMVKREKQ